MNRYSYKNDPAVPPFPDEHPIFVFDAECVFCSGWVQFALKHEREAKYDSWRHSRRSAEHSIGTTDSTIGTTR